MTMTRPDNLSLTMIALALVMTGASSLFAGSRDKEGSRRDLVPLWLFCLFACLTALASTWLSFIIGLELSTLSLFTIIRKGDEATSRLYLLAQLAGASVLLFATSLGSSFEGNLPLGPVPPGLFPLFVIGLGVKAALPGLHFWLPRTHSQAPTEASALLSGYAVKMGIYGLLRLVGDPSPPLLLLGIVMALYGVVQALLQHDAKRLLAYHTISQLGFIVAALSTGTPLGRTAALFHIVAHALFKGLLFLSAGSLERLYGSRDLNGLGRAGRDAPLLFGLFLVGASAIAGCPFTSGYVSKIVIKSALTDQGQAVLGLQLAGLGTTLSFCKFGYYGFWKSSGDRPEPRGFLGRQAYGAMALLAAATALVGAGPLLYPLLPLPEGTLLAPKALVDATIPVIAGIVLFALFPGLFRPRHKDVADVENALAPLGRLLLFPLTLLRLSHTGRLRAYIALIVAALIAIFHSL
ncbi:MAG: hypothetical protein JMJ93_08860 [Synergistaceae bacterium]|nr:hypothetical protein [Synergistaceae bacterium]